MIEVLKQALEALEDLLDHTETPPDKNCSCHIAPPCSDCVDYSGIRYAIKQSRDTITSLRQAIREHAMYEVQRLGQEIEQEPVAWRIKVETKLRDGSVDVGYQLRNEKMSAYDEPLYTHQPQRTWVGLTDEEENEYNYLGPDMHWVIQEIAAKLKEKNT